jgi:L-ascorbate metabolism protein UlaG (beta-lactamase superfamily)
MKEQRIIFLVILVLAMFTSITVSLGSDIEVTFISSSGFLLENGEQSILIDSLFGHIAEGKNSSPPDPDPDVYQKLISASAPFDKVDLVFITHSDLDHHHKETLKSFLGSNAKARVVMPFESQYYKNFEDRLIHLWPGQGKSSSLDIKGVKVTAIGVKHIGTREANHQAYFVELGGNSFLHLADVGGSSDEVIEQLEICKRAIGKPVDLVFITYWALEADGALEAIEKLLSPDTIVAMHIYKKDLKEAEELLSRLHPKSSKLILFNRTLQTKIINLP